MPRQAKQQIQWTNEKRTLTQFIPWPRNPRQIKGAQVKRLQDSFEEFGQPEQIVIGPANELYNGHQRLKSWLSEFGDIEIDVRVSSRPLSEKEREKLTLYLHKGAAGEWNFDELSGWELDELIEWGGFEPFELGLDDGEGEADTSESQDEEDDTSISDGSLLELINVTIDEPVHSVEKGEVWKVGPHILVCAEVITGWPDWVRFLKGDNLYFTPYPGPFIPLSLRAKEGRLLMVQPDPYIAGHILDRYAEVEGEDAVSKRD